MSSGTKFWVVIAAILGLLAYANQTPEPKRRCAGTGTMETVHSCFLLTATPAELEEAVGADDRDRRNDFFRR